MENIYDYLVVELSILLSLLIEAGEYFTSSCLINFISLETEWIKIEKVFQGLNLGAVLLTRRHGEGHRIVWYYHRRIRLSR
jgi:hypothetical protein